jgi:hypothetical protein
MPAIFTCRSVCGPGKIQIVIHYIMFAGVYPSGGPVVKLFVEINHMMYLAFHKPQSGSIYSFFFKVNWIWKC